MLVFQYPPLISGNQISFANSKIGLVSGENGNFALSTFTFKAKQPGSANITLTSVKLVGHGTNPIVTRWSDRSSSALMISPGEVRLDPSKVSTVTHETTNNGQKVTKVSLDANKLNEAFSTNAKLISLEVNSSDPIVNIQFTPAALQDSINNRANAIFKTIIDGASYSLPLRVLKGLPKDATISLTLTKVSGKTSEDVNKAVQQAGAQLITTPFDFQLAVNGTEIIDFNGTYVDRTLALHSVIDSAKTTAVWVDTNNNLHFIPSVFANSSSSAEVLIHSPHNSLYTVIKSNHSFTDLLGHWAKSDVEMLANKLIVNGLSDNQFAPDRQITRAEFAALLVRSLGLQEIADKSYQDVTDQDWYFGAVGAAKVAGLITGFDNGSFQPNANITREQMVTMIVRSLKFGGKEFLPGNSSLAKFTDRASISAWSKDAVEISLAAGIVQGTTDTTFAAQDNATRGQAAAMLKRMLLTLQFIN